MSTIEGQLGAPSTGAALDLKTPLRSTGTRVSGVLLGKLGLGVILISAVLVCLAAAHTNLLLPQTIQPVIGTPLAGPLSHIALHLRAGELLAALVAMFLGYLLAIRCAERLSPRLVIGVIAAFLAIVLLAPPLFSTDVFSYQAYARMFFMLHSNPYTAGPQVLNIPQDPLYHYIGAEWVNTPTVYGPLFTLLSGLFSTSSNSAIALSAFAYKAIAALSCAGTLWLLWHSARSRGLNPVRSVAIFGLNPLVVLYGVGGGHNDLLMLVAATAGLWALLGHRRASGGALVVGAAAIKLTGGLFLPFALASGHGLGAREHRRRILLGAALTAAVMLILGLAVFGTDILHLPITLDQVQNEGGWETIPGLVAVLVPWHTAGHLIGILFGLLFAGIFARLLWRVWNGTMDWIDASGWAAFWLLVASSQLMPWYIGWMLVPVALATNRRLSTVAMWFSSWILFATTIQYIPHGPSLIGL